MDDPEPFLAVKPRQQRESLTSAFLVLFVAITVCSRHRGSFSACARLVAIGRDQKRNHLSTLFAIDLKIGIGRENDCFVT